MIVERSIWVVGDIHGMLDPLVALLNTICTIEYGQQRQVLIVFLGDYIDHGPCSREVIDALLDLRREFSAVFLAGNHEDMMLEFLDPEPGLEDYGQSWFDKNGGQATVCSFLNNRQALSQLWMRSQGHPSFTAADLRLEPEYRAFLDALAYAHVEQLPLPGRGLTLAFSHASLYRRSDCRLQPRDDDPEIPITEQLSVRTRRDFRALMFKYPMWLDNFHIWNRELPRQRFGDFILVHGHTPTPIINTIHPGALPTYEPASGLPLVIFPEGRTVTPRLTEGMVRYDAALSEVVAINIDTGSVYGTALTALNFSSRRLQEEACVEAVQVHPGWVQRDFGACNRFRLQFSRI